MKHFNYLTDDEKKKVFHIEPDFDAKYGTKEELAMALGALLYMPATRLKWAEDVMSGKHEGLTSMVLDLEDALRDEDLKDGVKNIIRGFKQLEENERELPFIFVRVREHTQMREIVSELGDHAEKLVGFIFPKFNSITGIVSLEELSNINKDFNLHLYAMPILESKHVMYKENRLQELTKMKKIIDHYKDLVLNIRVGATDFSSLFGIRRTVDTTVYDMSVIRDCLVDIVNIFGRSEDGYTISGPVWEFFEGKNRVLKPQLRENLFRGKHGEKGMQVRSFLINQYVDGLIKEVIMDKINGFHGKTIIHPSHIKPVNSLLAVTFEEYMDAKVIVEGEEAGGVLKSEFSNKMNEVKPHLNWAKKIMKRAKIYGVLNPEYTFVDLIAANVKNKHSHLEIHS